MKPQPKTKERKAIKPVDGYMVVNMDSRGCPSVDYDLPAVFTSEEKLVEYLIESGFRPHYIAKVTIVKEVVIEVKELNR